MMAVMSVNHPFCQLNCNGYTAFIQHLMMYMSLHSDITKVLQRFKGVLIKVQRLESNLHCNTRTKAYDTETLTFCTNRKQDEFASLLVTMFTEHRVCEAVLGSCRIIYVENEQNMYRTCTTLNCSKTSHFY